MLLCLVCFVGGHGSSRSRILSPVTAPYISDLADNPLWELIEFSQSDLDAARQGTYRARGDDAVSSLYARVDKMSKHLELQKLVVYGLAITHLGTGPTHQYIHLGWFRAMVDISLERWSRLQSGEGASASSMRACWFDSSNNVQAYDLNHALVFVSPGHFATTIKALPYSPTAFYVSHGGFESKDNSIPALLQAAKLKYAIRYEKPDAREVDRAGVRSPRYTLYVPKTRILYQYWATDLTAREIEARKESVRSKEQLTARTKEVSFVGSVWSGNWDMFLVFEAAAARVGLGLHHYGQVLAGGSVSPAAFVSRALSCGLTSCCSVFAALRPTCGRTVLDAAKINAACLLAPSVQGSGQVEEQYVPCRIFKTTSAGALPLSNNPAVARVFPDGQAPIIVPHAEVEEDAMVQLLQQGADLMRDHIDLAQEKILAAMKHVQEEHTYLSRIVAALTVFDCENGGDGGGASMDAFCFDS